MMRAVTFFDGTALREGTLSVRGPRLVLHPDPAPAGTARLEGIVTGRFTDHHVHLQLVDPAPLRSSRLGRVIDLGGNPEVLRSAAHTSGGSSQIRGQSVQERADADVSPELCQPDAVREDIDIAFAGAFLTAVGGYPADRAWAPAGSVREIADADAAQRAVQEMTDAGASWIKVVGNSEAGPVLDDELFRAVVRTAADHGLPVVAHAEGPGQAQRVARLGASRLAHSPFTERLTDEEIAEQAASVSWISTMAIHEGPAYANVVDNVRRFVVAGGTLFYGSDMGNGPTPVDLRDSEIAALREAGIDGVDLLRMLAPCDPLVPDVPLLRLPDGDPLRARRLIAADAADGAVPAAAPAESED